MAQTDALIGIGVDLSAMRREISKLPNMVDSEAQAALVRFEKTLHKATAASKKANKSIARANKKASAATTKHTAALGDFQDAAGDADSTIMGLTGALDMVSPSMSDAATVAGDLGAGFEAITRLVKGGNPLLLALAAATAALAAGYAMWADEQAKHKRVVEASTAALQDHHGLLKDLDSANVDLRVTLGLMTAEEQELGLARKAAHAKLLPMLEKQNATISEQSTKLVEARVKYEELLAIVERLKGMSEMQRYTEKANLRGMQESLELAAAAYSAQIVEMQRMNAEREAGRSLADRELEAIEANIKARHQQAEAAEDALKNEILAARLMADAEAGAANVEREKLEREEKVRAARQQAADEALAAQQAANRAAIAGRELDLIRREVLGEISEAEGDLIRQYDREIARVQELGEVSGRRGEAEAEAYRLAMESEEALGDLREAETLEALMMERQLQAAHDERMTARADAEREDHEARMAQLHAEADAIISSTADIMGSMSSLADLKSSESERMAEEAMARADELREAGLTSEADAEEAKAALHQQAAIDAFNRAQSLSKAEVAMSTAAAIMEAWVSSGGNPLFAIPMSAAVAAAGIVQLATINAQQPPAFDIGGMVGGVRTSAPDSFPALLRPGEGVLTPKGVDAIGGPAGLHAANRGQPTAPQVVALPVFRHLDRAIAVELRRPGALKRAISKAGSTSGRTGQRGY